MNAARYLRRLALATLLLVALLASVNYYADPYGVWRYGLPGDTIQSRPAIRNQERMHKAHAVRLVDADCLILGNSRVVVGLDPNHPLLPEKTYNLGLSASNIYECYRYLQHAVAFKKPKMVLFAIDKGMFDAASTPEVDFDEARLAVAADGTPQPRWRYADIPETLLSLDALVDSLKTLRDKTSVKYKDGMRDEVLMKPYTVPSKILAENERWKDGSRKLAWNIKDGSNKQREAFMEFLSFCHSQDIRLVVLTNPLHSGLLDLEISDPVAFRRWLIWVGNAVRTGSNFLADSWGLVPSEGSGWWEGKIPHFVNFYGFNPISSEPFPSPDERVSAMKNYWEISHYRKAVGDLMIEVLVSSEPVTLSFSFGRKTNDGDALWTWLDRERAEWKAGKIQPSSIEKWKVER